MRYLYSGASGFDAMLRRNGTAGNLPTSTASNTVVRAANDLVCFGMSSYR